MYKHLSLLFIFAFIWMPVVVIAQTPVWGFRAGSTGVDAGQACKVAPNGNLIVTGKFSGTMDIDPGPGVYNIVSHGATDIFVACYTQSGGFLWGFGIGGANYDGGWYVTTDNASNVFVCGFINSTGIDFDPGPGVTTIPYAGGGALSYEGDGFVAKYLPTGIFLWAKDLGGGTDYDQTVSLATDGDGNLYAGGVFSTSMAVAGGPTFLSTVAGTAYIIKYSPSGSVIWGHNFGQVGGATADCSVYSLAVSGGVLYACGYFRGLSNFNPWGASFTLFAGATLNYDAFLAKYDTAGNFIYAKQIAGAGNIDVLYQLKLDSSENVYVSGLTNGGSVIFNTASPGTSTLTSPGGGGNYDIIMAKYNSAGVYQWGAVMGSAGDDIGYSIDVAGSNLYLTGQFTNTVDFDPSSGIANLVSSGGKDVFIAKYDLAGNYVCGFRVGAPSTDDLGNGFVHDTSGFLYSVGQFGGVATDFDPTAGTYTLTSAGSTDAFLVKYNYAGPPSYTGTLAGSTICPGMTASLTVTITSGPSGPYNITYTDGTSIYTVAGVTSGVPFAVLPSPVATSTYTVTTAVYGGSSVCNPPTVIIALPATITVTPLSALIDPPVSSCTTVTYSTLTAGILYNWSYGDGGTGTGTPVSHTYTASGIYTATLSVTSGGCSAVDTSVVVISLPPAITGINSICIGGTTTFSNSTGGGTWTSSNGIVATVGSVSGVVTGVEAGIAQISYILPNGCIVTRPVSVNPSPVISGTLIICAGASTTLISSIPGGTWSSGLGSVATVAPSGVVTGVAAGTATITNYPAGSTCTAIAIVTVNALPQPITGIPTVCVGSSVTLSDLTVGGSWASSNLSVATAGSVSGVVTGISSGTSLVTYSLSATGCYVTMLLTVNPYPVISGVLSLCVGSATALTTSIAGTWSSDNTVVAPVSGAGMVTGLTAGTATITCFPSGSSCTATVVVTVNPQPIAIVGALNLCAGATTLLTDATSGGSWSSSNSAVASVGSISGIVSGATSGTAVITYRLPLTGCYVTAIVTVNPLPSSIGGILSVCVGATTILSNATTGGTWTSSNPGTGSIGLATGIVTGISAGTTTVTYTVTSTGCYTVAIVTVNALPPAIVGIGTLCPGTGSAMTDPLPGGTWSSSNTSVASVGLSSGFVNGISGGTSIITYTTSCGFVIFVVTVSPVSSPITGNAPICVGASVALTHSVPGGTWSCSPASVAVIGSGSGVVTGLAAGTATVSYAYFCGPIALYSTIIVTVNPNPSPIAGVAVCVGATSTLFVSPTGGIWSGSSGNATVGSATGIVLGIAPGTALITYLLPTGCRATTIVTVDPLPAAIAGTLILCTGATTVLTDATAGGTWTSSTPATATIDIATGVVTSVAAGTANITYTLSTTGCWVTAVFTVTPGPGPISGGPIVCTGGTLLLTDVVSGGTWTSGNTAVAVIGSVSGIVTGIASGVDTITYSIGTGCFVIGIVTVNPGPAVISGTPAACPGSGATLSTSVSGGIWTSSNPAIATVGSLSGFVSPLSVGTSVITYTSPAGCAVTIVFTVYPLPAPILGATALCVGFTTALSTTTTGGTWTSSNGVVASVSSVGSVFGVSAGTAIITYELASGCYTTLTIVVNPLPPPISGGPIACAGGLSVLLSNPVPGGAWTSSALTIASVDIASGQVTGYMAGTVTITYTLPTGCKITKLINVSPPPAVAAGPGDVCVGSSIVLTDASPGGNWISGSPAVASINSYTGLLHGISPGTTLVSYILLTGCFTTIVINVHPLPFVLLPAELVDCNHSSAVIHPIGVGSSGMYLWSPAAGLSCTSCAAVLASPTTTTQYSVTVTDVYGCVTTVATTVVVDTLLDHLSISGKDSICAGMCDTLYALGFNSNFSVWSSFGSASCANCPTTVFCPSTSLTYFAVGSDSLGCTDSVSFMIAVLPHPIVSVSPDPLILCPGETKPVTATDNNGGVGSSFSWFPSTGLSCTHCSSPFVSVATDGLYLVTDIDAFGCTDSATLAIKILPKATNTIRNDTLICSGTSVRLFATTTRTNPQYWWTSPSGMNDAYSSDPVVSPDTTTTYTLTLLPKSCYNDTERVTVYVEPTPVITLSPSVTATAGTIVTLTATVANVPGYPSYRWTPPDGLSCDRCLTTTAVSFEGELSHTYTFTAISDHGCPASADVTIKYSCEGAEVFIPNTFTPNNDGANDRFFVSAKGISIIKHMIIFDRWGEMVFEARNISPNDPMAGWDGTFRNKRLGSDVFVYVIDAKCEFGAIFVYKGDISIVR